MKKIAFLLSILILLASCISKQEETQKIKSEEVRARHKIRSITLEFQHSLRIPNHHITIEIINRKEPAMEIKSKAMNDDPEWQTFNRDTTIAISKEQFEMFKIKTKKLKEIDLDRANLAGLDGTTCSITLGYFNSVSYKFWTPTSKTKERGLSDFIELCEDILQTAGFDPKEIL